MKRKISLVLSIVLVLTTLFSVNVFAKTPKVYYQNRNQSWSDYPYGKGDTGLKNDKATISTSGCALLSITNAVYHLNDNFINPEILAKLALSNGDRENYSGTHDAIVKHAAEKYGGKYGFKYVGTTDSESELKKVLQNNGAAVWHAVGHFMAIVEYNFSNNKYLILDSYPSNNRGTARGYAWKTFKQIQKLGIRKYDGYKGFMLIKSTEITEEKEKAKTIKWPATKNIKTYVISTSNNTTVYKTATSKEKYGTIYESDLVTINGYSGSRLKVTYPISGGKTKTGYIDKSAVTSSNINVATNKKTAKSKITAYRRSSGNSELGYISKGDVYYQIATKNGRKQVIYPISGGYKMGWIK